MSSNYLTREEELAVVMAFWHRRNVMVYLCRECIAVQNYKTAFSWANKLKTLDKNETSFRRKFNLSPTRRNPSITEGSCLLP